MPTELEKLLIARQPNLEEALRDTIRDMGSAIKTGWDTLTTPTMPDVDKSLSDATGGVSPWLADTSLASLLSAGVAPKAVKLGSTGIKGLYSRLGRAVESLPQTDTATAVRKFLQRRATKEEMEATGLAKLLAGKKAQERVSPQEVAQKYLENPLKLEVKTLGEPPEGGYKVVTNGDTTSIIEADGTVRWSSDGVRLRPEQIDALSNNWLGLKPAPKQPTKYSQYTLPGGKNYRETLIKLDRPIDKDRIDAIGDELEVLYRNPDYGAGVPNSRRLAERAQQLTNERDKLRGIDNYRSAHWPGEINPVAHVRYNERSLPNPNPHDGTWEGVYSGPGYQARRPGVLGPQADTVEDAIEAGERYSPTGSKGRFIEEIQSDWHEHGRDHGYIQPNTVSSLREKREEAYQTIEKLKAEARAMWQPMEDGGPGYIDKVNEIDNAAQAMLEIDNALHKAQSGVPDAPFKESWPSLALKQQVMDVVDRPDLEWIGWTPGSVQNDRYDLSSHVNKLAFDWDSEHNHGYFRAWDKDGRESVFHEVESPEELVPIIGKDAASRLMNQKPKYDPAVAGNMTTYELTGEDLQVGGEGMNAFYDEQLPDRMNKILKPFGGKVEQTSLTVPDILPPAAGKGPKAIQAWIARLSPEMKERIKKEGLPLLILLLAREMENANDPN